MVIDKMTQCENCKDHNAKGQSFRRCGPMLEGIISRKDRTFERDDKTGNVSLERTAMAKRKITRSCRNSQSSTLRLSNRKASFPNSAKE